MPVILNAFILYMRSTLSFSIVFHVKNYMIFINLINFAYMTIVYV
jgi:hypothetical protein